MVRYRGGCCFCRHAITDEPRPPPRIQKRHDGVFPHQAWTHHWATFSERARVAARLGCSVEQFDALVKLHGWQLQPPPALKPPDDALSRAVRFGGGKKTRLAATDFVADEEGTTPAVETRVEVLADDAELRLEFPCAEAAENPLLTRATHPTSEFHRSVLVGDAFPVAVVSLVADDVAASLGADAIGHFAPFFRRPSLTPQPAAPIGGTLVNPVVDRLLRQPTRTLARKAACDAAGDLAGRPEPLLFLADIPVHVWIVQLPGTATRHAPFFHQALGCLDR